MPSAPTARPRVLVVDDQCDGAETLGKLLELLGCDVQWTLSGEEALRVAPDFRPQLVVLDIQMPGGIDGLETARQLRAQGWAEKSILVSHSGARDPALAELSKQAGCNHHLLKPATADAFREILQALREARC